MKKKPYLPKRESERVTWLNTFSTQLAIHGPTVGVSAAEITLVQAMALIYAYIIGLIDLSKAFTQELTKFKDTLSFAALGTVLGALPSLTPGVAPPLTQSGIFSRIGEIVTRLKKHTGYTPAIGESLGVIGDEITFDEANYKTTLKGKSLPSNNEVTFTKEGVEGINVYSHPVDGTDPNVWEKIGFDSSSPYNDTRPPRADGVPENRQYKARGVINDVEIGQWSDILNVTFND